MPSIQAEHCIPDRWSCHSVRASPPWTTCSPIGAVVHQRVQAYGLFDKFAGGVVNSAIALAIARGIQKATGSGQVNELGRGWSKSFMERMGTMGKDTQMAKMFPPNSEELKESFDIFNGGGEQHSS